MAQYQVGTIQVTNGSTTVTGIDPDPGNPQVSAPQQWALEVQAGDWMIVGTDAVWYEIQTVVSDAEITLASPYLGNTTVPGGTPNVGDIYAIHRDFTTNYDLMILSAGDRHTAEAVREAINKLDTVMKSLDDRIGQLENP